MNATTQNGRMQNRMQPYRLTQAMPATILLVEDDDVDALCVERAFRKAGQPHAIRRVRDGLEALVEDNGRREVLP